MRFELYWKTTLQRPHVNSSVLIGCGWGSEVVTLSFINTGVQTAGLEYSLRTGQRLS